MTTQQQIERLEELRAELLLLIDTSIDSMMKQIAEVETDGVHIQLPLSSSSKVFKGRKPKAVIINNIEYPVKTWKKLVQAILKEVVTDEKYYQKLQNITDKVYGSKRVILSSDYDRLDRPIPITDNIFIEGYYDAEMLLDILKEKILKEIGFDCSDIYIRYEL